MMQAGILAGAALATAMVVASIVSQPAAAAVTVLDGQNARVCQTAAEAAAQGFAPDQAAVDTCGFALDTELLTDHDEAGTLVNRGILYLARADYADAVTDFTRAETLQPQIGEIYTNRGAALIAERHFAAGIAEIDRGLPLQPGEPEKAYFNRALAREELGDVKGAYLDFRKAAELKPDWPTVQDELARFTVTPAPKRH